MPKSQTHECYFCGNPATSTEHVPPKCLFPEQKDLCEKDYRKNLITVPSCDEHNSRKSRDDEFLMACLAPVVGNNPTGYLHTKTKVVRAQARNPHLINDTMREARKFNLPALNGISFPVLVGKPDMPRLCRSLQAVARGLYFHARGTRFTGKVAVIPSFVDFQPGSTISVIQVLSQRMSESERQRWESHGDNPQIFSYRIGPVDQFGLTPMVMTFYSRTEVFTAFQPEGVRLPHKSIFDATPDNPIDVKITLGEGEGAHHLTWRCTGD